MQNSEIFFAMSSVIELLGAADQEVGLDADLAQLADRLLGRLGLQLAAGAQEGHQREVDEDAVLRPDLEGELADRLEERQALDVADVPPISVIATSGLREAPARGSRP